MAADAPDPEQPPFAESETAKMPRFGDRGQVAISSAFEASVHAPTNSSGTSILIAPSVDVFVARGWSLGGEAELSYALDRGAATTRYGAGVHGGYAAALGRSWSVWFRVTLRYEHVHVPGDLSDCGSGFGVVGMCGRYSVDHPSMGGTAFLPVLFHPAPHAFLGFGPYVDVMHDFDDYETQQTHTDLGARFVLGVWF